MQSEVAKKIISLVGFARKSGNIVIGVKQVLSAIRVNKVKLILLASDASDQSKKKVLDKAKYYEIFADASFESAVLSKAIGKENRMCIGITDSGFANSIKSLIKKK